MRNLLTIFRRECGAYFNSPIAAIFVIVFIVFNNGLFMLQFFQIGKADMRLFFNALPFILSVFIAAISMRLWAEDRKGHTFELLLTFPMRPHELVLGKYLAGLAFFAFALATTATIPLMIQMVGRADPGPILGGYLGAFLLGGLYLAVGIFISGLATDQIVAFVLTMVATFLLHFSGTDFVATVLDGWAPGFGAFVKNTVGAEGHLVRFGRGIVDAADVLYFAVASGAFLFLNGLSLEGRWRPRSRTVYAAAVAVALASTVLANWLLRDLGLPRWDVTEGKVHTISPVTARILRDLKVPVQAQFYVSPPDQMPTVLKTLEQDVRDKLQELSIVSDGRFQYRIVHLEAVPEESDPLHETLRNRGVIPFQVESVQRDEVGVKVIYSTLVIEYKEKTPELIPRVLPVTLLDLEYQLVSRIRKLALEERPLVAVFAPVRERELPAEVEQLVGAEGEVPEKEYLDDFKTAVLLVRQNGYDVRRVSLDEKGPLPENAKLLLVLGPRNLSARQRYEINRFLHGGGRVAVAAQGYAFTYARAERGVEAVPEKLPLDVNQLLGRWGVTVGEDLLFDESSEVISLSTGQRIGPFALQMPVKFPNQIVVEEASINRSASLTNRIPGVFYLWGSALQLDAAALERAKLEATVLFSSSRRSWTAPAPAGNLTEENTRPPAEMKGPFPLAVLVEGRFPDAFDGKRPPREEGGAAEAADLGEPKPGKLLVVGCSKSFSEDLIHAPGNLNFFANVVDGFTLGEELIEIRAKTPVVRDLRRVSSAAKLGYRFFTVGLVPLALVALGIGRAFLRRKEKELYLQALGSKA
jgi:ABC-type uncharacterized transport system involved in gliding motility auxiliary subunit